jgi:hypothetical protein
MEVGGWVEDRFKSAWLMPEDKRNLKTASLSRLKILTGD